jgi:hypothetical protein
MSWPRRFFVGGHAYGRPPMEMEAPADPAPVPLYKVAASVLTEDCCIRFRSRDGFEKP